MNFLTYLVASFLAYLLLIGLCVIYAGVTRKTWKQQRSQEQTKSFAERISDYQSETAALKEDPIANLHSVEWTGKKGGEIIEVKFEECHG